MLGLVCYFLICVSSQAQIISTIAGNGTIGSTGDGGPASVAGLVNNNSVIVDGSGNIYITDGHTIRKISSSGIISTIAGTGIAGYNGDGIPATNAKLNSPMDIAIDDSGNLYIADMHNQRVRKVDAGGFITTISGNGSMGYSGDGNQATDATFRDPTHLILDKNGNLYIADSKNNVIRKIDTSGTITTVAGEQYVITLGTYCRYGGDNGPATAAYLCEPRDMLIDTSGCLYICDAGNHRVRKVNNSGIISTFAGNGLPGYPHDGNPATASSISVPFGITAGMSGNVYILSTDGPVVRGINTGGLIYTYAGNGTSGYSGDGGPSLAAQLNNPAGIAMDMTGVMYIADHDNYRVRKISAPTVVHEAGNKLSYAVFPNPANNNVQFSGLNIVSIKLYNTFGRLLKEAYFTDNIDVSDIPAGIYFFRLFNKNNELLHQSVFSKE